ncbi:hypothetical protein [Rappaport israeli]|nr:hypothetical protein [Rappaport israeli]
MDFVDAVGEGDLSQAYEGFVVVVASEDLALIEGLVLDVKNRG